VGQGLRQLANMHDLTAWVTRAHDARLLVALAGKLTIEDLSWLVACNADIVGVRGAACENGRSGRATDEELRAMADIVRISRRPTRVASS